MYQLYLVVDSDAATSASRQQTGRLARRSLEDARHRLGVRRWQTDGSVESTRVHWFDVVHRGSGQHGSSWFEIGCCLWRLDSSRYFNYTVLFICLCICHHSICLFRVQTTGYSVEFTGPKILSSYATAPQTVKVIAVNVGPDAGSNNPTLGQKQSVLERSDAPAPTTKPSGTPSSGGTTKTPGTPAPTADACPKGTAGCRCDADKCQGILLLFLNSFVFLKFYFFPKKRQFIMCWRFVCCVERLHSRRNRLFVQPRRVREFARRVCGRLVCASLVSRRVDRLSVLQRRRWLWSECVSVCWWSRRVCTHVVRRPVFAEEGLSKRARLSVRRPESVWCTGHLRSGRALCVARMSRFVLFIRILLFDFKYLHFFTK